MQFRFLAAVLIAGSASFQSAAAVFAQEAAPMPSTMTLEPQLEPPAANSQPPRSHGVDHSISELNALATTTNNLIDHGGPVLASANIYVIYWGDPSDFPADFSDGLSKFYQGFSNSSYSNVLTQYLRGAPPPSVTLAGSASDTSPAPTRPPKLKRVVKEACTFAQGNVDPNGIYVVAASEAPNDANFCAWHRVGNCKGSKIVVVYLPNVNSACRITTTSANNYSANTQSMVNYAAHELAESMTDPQINAWLDSRGREVADKCETKFAAPVTLSNGSVWKLQELWSNGKGKCLQTLPLP